MKNSHADPSQNNDPASSGPAATPSSRRGRAKVRVGDVGVIGFTKTGASFRADATTRDLTGRIRRIRASGLTKAEAESAVRQKAASLGLSPDVISGASTLGELLELWLAEIVSSRNIRPQTALMYRTKANRLARLYGGIEVSTLRTRRMQVIVNDLAKQMKASEFQSL